MQAMHSLLRINDYFYMKFFNVFAPFLHALYIQLRRPTNDIAPKVTYFNDFITKKQFQLTFWSCVDIILLHRPPK